MNWLLFQDYQRRFLKIKLTYHVFPKHQGSTMLFISPYDDRELLIQLLDLILFLLTQHSEFSQGFYELFQLFKLLGSSHSAKADYSYKIIEQIMDQYLKRKRVENVTTQQSHNRTQPVDLGKMLKQQLQQISEQLRKLSGKFGVVEQIIKNIGTPPENQQASNILGESQMHEPQRENGLSNREPSEYYGFLQQPHQLDITESMVDQRGPNVNVKPKTNLTTQELQQSSKIAERTRKIKKRS